MPAGHARHLDSPMVGRDHGARPHPARSGPSARPSAPRTCSRCSGRPGVGKSRLIREFLDGVEDATVLRGRCLSYGDGITFYALGEIVRQAAGIADADDPDTAAAKLVGAVSGRRGRRPDRSARRGLFGWADPSSAEDASWAVRKLFEHRRPDRPVVVVIDDIHWAEPTAPRPRSSTSPIGPATR